MRKLLLSFVLLVTISIGHAQAGEVTCNGYPGDAICWHLRSLHADFVQCAEPVKCSEIWPKARFHTRYEAFTQIVNSLPEGAKLSAELVNLAEAAYQAKQNIKPPAGPITFEEYAKELRIELSFGSALDMLRGA